MKKLSARGFYAILAIMIVATFIAEGVIRTVLGG